MAQQALGKDLLAEGGVAPETLEAEGDDVELGRLKSGKLLPANQEPAFLIGGKIEKFQS